MNEKKNLLQSITIDAGEVFTAPRDGYFLSSEYLKRILDAQVEKGF